MLSGIGPFVGRGKQKRRGKARLFCAQPRDEMRCDAQYLFSVSVLVLDYRRPKNDRTAMTMTTSPTMYTMLFMEDSFQQSNGIKSAAFEAEGRDENTRFDSARLTELQNRENRYARLLAVDSQ